MLQALADLFEDSLAHAQAMQRAQHEAAGSKALALALGSAPWLKSQRAQGRLASLASAALANQIDAAALAPTTLAGPAWQDLQALQRGAWQQLQRQQLSAFNGWLQWCQEYGELKKANTMSKLLEQEYNLAAQLNALMTSQATALVGLLENLQVDFAYWAAMQRQPEPA